MNTIKRVIFFVILILFSQNSIVQTYSTNTSLIELAIYNHVMMLGYCNIGDGHSDFYSTASFSLGILNRHTSSIILDMVNITIIQLIDNCISTRNTISLQREDGFPISLKPSRYWSENITTPQKSTIGIEISIQVNSMIFEFGKVIEYGMVNESYQNWSNWKKINSVSPSFEIIIPSLGLLFSIFLFRKKPSQLDMKKK